MCTPCLPLGLVLLLAVLTDLLWTTLWVDGGSGPLASRLSSGLWRGIVAAPSHGARTIAGPLILFATLAMWLVLMWAGWTLVFVSSEAALVPGSAEVAVDLPATMYFVAYSMFASGNGDLLPASSLWQIVTSLVIATGILLVTLGIPYVLSVIGAVPDKRAFASGVENLGMDGPEFVATGWNGEDFQGLVPKLASLSDQLDRLAQDHLAYPVLHYYHTRRDEHAEARALVTFDEALTLLRFGVREDVRPEAAVLTSARGASRDYLDTLEHAFAFPKEEPPPAPSLDRLRERGIPTVSEEAFHEALAELEDRRRELWAVIEADAREWPGREPE